MYCFLRFLFLTYLGLSRTISSVIQLLLLHHTHLVVKSSYTMLLSSVHYSRVAPRNRPSHAVQRVLDSHYLVAKGQSGTRGAQLPMVSAAELGHEVINEKEHSTEHV